MLDGYAKFLQDKDLALDRHQPHLLRWVREFLLFARALAGHSFEQTLDLFLAEVGGRVGTKPWQLQQASDAIRIYRYEYRGAKAGDGDSPTAQAFVDVAASRREARAGEASASSYRLRQRGDGGRLGGKPHRTANEVQPTGAAMEVQTQPPNSDRRSAIRSSIFFSIFAIAMLAFGCWMSFRFGFGEEASHPLRSVAVVLGVCGLNRF